MKISIPITRDSENSYPSADIEIYLADDAATVKITDSEREVTVKKEDLRKLLVAILV